MLDNADDPTFDLKPYLQWKHGNVIITTRNSKLKVYAPDSHFEVDRLEEDEAIRLLVRGIKGPHDEDTARAIVQVSILHFNLVRQALRFRPVCGMLGSGRQPRKRLHFDYRVWTQRVLGALSTTEEEKSAICAHWTHYGVVCAYDTECLGNQFRPSARGGQDHASSFFIHAPRSYSSPVVRNGT
jgi:hypothetical protein